MFTFSVFSYFINWFFFSFKCHDVMAHLVWFLNFQFSVSQVQLLQVQFARTLTLQKITEIKIEFEDKGLKSVPFGQDFSPLMAREIHSKF